MTKVVKPKRNVMHKLYAEVKHTYGMSSRITSFNQAECF